MDGRQDGIDVTDYKARAAKGAIQVQRVGPGLNHMIVRRYAESTGEELTPRVVPVNAGGIRGKIADAERSRAAIDKEIADLRDLLADVEAIDPPKQQQNAAEAKAD